MAYTWTKETRTHLNEHVMFPATGKAVLEACNQMSDVSQADREMARKKLSPTKTYRSADDVMSDLNR